MPDDFDRMIRKEQETRSPEEKYRDFLYRQGQIRKLQFEKALNEQDKRDGKLTHNRDIDIQREIDDHKKSFKYQSGIDNDDVDK